MASWLTQQPGRSPYFPFHNPQALRCGDAHPCALEQGQPCSQFSLDTKVSLSPALPAALVTTLPSYSLVPVLLPGAGLEGQAQGPHGLHSLPTSLLTVKSWPNVTLFSQVSANLPSY